MRRRSEELKEESAKVVQSYKEKDEEWQAFIELLSCFEKKQYGSTMDQLFHRLGFLPTDEYLEEELQKKVDKGEVVVFDKEAELQQCKIDWIKDKVEECKEYTLDYGLRDIHRMIFRIIAQF